LKGDYRVIWAPQEGEPIPSRGELGHHEAAARSSDPQETSLNSTNNKINIGRNKVNLLWKAKLRNLLVLT